jgi:hypothetical protein
MHAIAVELDLVQPVRPVRRLVDKLGELWLDPLRERGFGATPACGGSRHVLCVRLAGDGYFTSNSSTARAT